MRGRLILRNYMVKLRKGEFMSGPRRNFTVGGGRQKLRRNPTRLVPPRIRQVLRKVPAGVEVGQRFGKSDQSITINRERGLDRGYDPHLLEDKEDPDR